MNLNLWAFTSAQLNAKRAGLFGKIKHDYDKLTLSILRCELREIEQEIEIRKKFKDFINELSILEKQNSHRIRLTHWSNQKEFIKIEVSLESTKKYYGN